MRFPTILQHLLHLRTGFVGGKKLQDDQARPILLQERCSGPAMPPMPVSPGLCDHESAIDSAWPRHCRLSLAAAMSEDNRRIAAQQPSTPGDGDS